ncbi:composite domain of metallo-dependent hydrolase [Aspergillus homomorphus CBS 101889]|uniref:Composite domain of metallo-dependent hydrolase n=1 Tax=Aspergillus homomorphus (strain CBS 101889) TaxID=1450537 RepID=A0A395I4S0_ASPHC|nr:composite domain of metallo-dependent hydrolase [Aspergillus homomorphus CBS 101889]RAL14746.1 composite domain of metallo-dependent hydrolase [Aspergillus homomorphus CBS 101889]
MGSIGEVQRRPYRPTPADITINNHRPEDPQKILFQNVRILDSTGADPYSGDVLIEGERIVSVGQVDPAATQEALVIDGGGTKTLMSGLADSHTHLSWNNAATLDELTSLPLEEHVLHTANSARSYLNCGYTMCFGAAAAQPRLDIAIKAAIKSGLIPGPRTLANCPEVTKPDGAIIPKISRYASGPEEMRQVVREFVALGTDNIKLSMTGDNVHPTMPSEETYFDLEETVAAVEEAHLHGKRVCAHARSAASVKQCVQAGVDVIYHASFADTEGLDLLEQHKDSVWVAPAINLFYAMAQGDAEPYGVSAKMSEQKGVTHEVEVACQTMREMRRRGIRVLPGGDYGFAWAPHGTYARDLQHFVDLFGYTPMESILAATAMAGELMGHPDELGKVQPGYYADVILVDGNPLEDIRILQNQDHLHAVIINGHIHKHVNGKNERVAA